MSFFGSLKKIFIYSGEQDNEVSSDNRTKTEKGSGVTRLDVTNPIRRIKDIRSEAVESVKNLTTQENGVVTDSTRGLIYEAFYNVIESKINKGKPLVEAKLLFKRFLEDEITNESLYSDEDLLYIQTLVNCVKELKSDATPKTIDREDLLNQIIESPRLLEIIELYDNYYHMGMMKYLCEANYIICGYTYNSKGVVSGLKEKVTTPYFPITIGDTTFYLLSEVKSLISEDSSEEAKREYITSKLKTMVKRFVILNDISTRALYPPYVLFNVWLKERETEAASEPVVKEDVTTNDVEQTLGEAEIQEKMFEGISKDVNNPVSILKKESNFVTLYGPLASPANPDVELEDLEMAIKDIGEMVENGYELSAEEFKIYKSIKARYALLSDDGGV